MRFLLILSILVFAIKLPAQELPELSDSVELNFLLQTEAYPQEKIYVQTDKPDYLSGERIWFRAHLVNAQTHNPFFISRYVYVEIISPMEDLIERVKVRPDSLGAYAGYVDLAEDLVEGTYTLRAYTNYMRNMGDAYFFKKTIQVLDPFSLKIEPLVKFDVKKNEADVVMQFVDRQTNDTIFPEIVSCKLIYKEAKTVSPKNSRYSWNVKLPPKIKNRTMLLSLVYKGRKFNRFYTIPYEQTDFHVSFFPEGGYVIPGKISQMAFKAVNPDGLGEDIIGTLYNSKDEKIHEFSSFHLGMGFFNFIPVSGETYYTICRNSQDFVKRFELPPAEERANAVNARILGGRLLLSVRSGDAAQKDSLSLLLHHKGEVIYHERWNPSAEAYIFPAKELPTGIINILLINSSREIVSERILFNLNEEDLPELRFQTAKTQYKRRELVSVNMEYPKDDSLSYSGNGAVSVIDMEAVVQDTVNNIVSTLLLSSELKGYIESPASYFSNGKINTNAMDVLMLTQGWRRYDIPKVLQGEIDIPEAFEPELAQTIRGEADGLFRSLKEGEISLIATLDSLVSSVTVQADEKGKFVFNVEYPDGTSILIQSLSKKGGKMNMINIDQQTFPETQGAAVPLHAASFSSHNDDLSAFLQKADEEYTQKSGIRNIMLDEVTVVAKSIEKYQESVFYSPLSATGIRTSEDIEKMAVSSLRSLLYSQSGIIVKTDKVTTTRSDLPVLFVIDDLRFEDFFDRLDDIDVTSIESIFVVRDNSMIPGYYPNTSGAIVITTKMGYKEKPKKQLNIDHIIPLGYQQAAAFYSPVYETREQIDSSISDIRTTIYWNPSVQFSEQGEAKIEFYTADSSTKYKMIFEGVGSDGKIIHSSYEIQVGEINSQK